MNHRYELSTRLLNVNAQTLAVDVNLIHKALANAFRRDVLAWLKKPDEIFAHESAGFAAGFARGVPANTIQAHSGLSQSTVSAHLATLTDAGLLVSHRMGQWILLSRNESVIEAFVEHVSASL